MKYISILLICITVSGCGVAERLGKDCGGDLKELCLNVFGGRVDNSQDEIDTRQDSEIDELKKRVSALENDLYFVRSEINAAFVALQNTDASQQSQIDNLTGQLNVFQTQNNSILVQLANLNGYTHIVSIKDPCGTQGSWNEVLLKLNTGKYLASFSENSNGKNTRFVVLQDGNYLTTDGTNCHFTVSGSGTIISNEHN